MLCHRLSFGPPTADIVQELPLLIVDEYGGGFFDAQPRKKIAPPQGFVLIRDFANGLLLYRRELVVTFRFVVWLVVTLSGWIRMPSCALADGTLARGELLTVVCLAFGLGIGISSCILFVGLLVSSNWGPWLFCAEGAILFSGFCFCYDSADPTSEAARQLSRSRIRSLRRSATVVFSDRFVYAATVLSLAIFLMYSLMRVMANTMVGRSGTCAPDFVPQRQPLDGRFYQPPGLLSS